MTTTSTNGTNSNTAQTSTAQPNLPTHEIFLVEGDGKDTTWTKVGVAFPTRSGSSHRVFVGKRGDPKQKVYLVCPNSQFDGDGKDTARPGDEPKRRPYANIFDATGNNVDFQKNDGVAFLNRDDSLSLLIGDRGDPQQLKYQMREVRRPAKPAANGKTAAKSAADTAKPAANAKAAASAKPAAKS
jgi:hypothetical protein